MFRGPRLAYISPAVAGCAPTEQDENGPMCRQQHSCYTSPRQSKIHGRGVVLDTCRWNCPPVYSNHVEEAKCPHAKCVSDGKSLIGCRTVQEPLYAAHAKYSRKTYSQKEAKFDPSAPDRALVSMPAFSYPERKAEDEDSIVEISFVRYTEIWCHPAACTTCHVTTPRILPFTSKQSGDVKNRTDIINKSSRKGSSPVLTNEARFRLSI